MKPVNTAIELIKCIKGTNSSDTKLEVRGVCNSLRHWRLWFCGRPTNSTFTRNGVIGGSRNGDEHVVTTLSSFLNITSRSSQTSGYSPSSCGRGFHSQSLHSRASCQPLKKLLQDNFLGFLSS